MKGTCVRSRCRKVWNGGGGENRGSGKLYKMYYLDFKMPKVNLNDLLHCSSTKYEHAKIKYALNWIFKVYRGGHLWIPLVPLEYSVHLLYCWGVIHILWWCCGLSSSYGWHCGGSHHLMGDIAVGHIIIWWVTLRWVTLSDGWHCGGSHHYLMGGSDACGGSHNNVMGGSDICGGSHHCMLNGLHHFILYYIFKYFKSYSRLELCHTHVKKPRWKSMGR